MKLIQVLELDDVRHPNTVGCAVFAVNRPIKPLKKRMLEMKFPTVFADGVGKLEGEHHICLDLSVYPVQQAPRIVQIALRAKVKEALDDLVCQEVLALASEPTPWISSMVVMPKQNGNLRICLDPKNLNCALPREHYPIATIEDITARLHGVKVFNILDVCSGFWHISLDEESSRITIFNTSFGWYRWKRLLFGISLPQKCFSAEYTT